MKQGIIEQEIVRQYLLGQAQPGELPQLEERLLTESAFYEELLIVEDELIDQYLSGELSQPERESFETNFLLTPERQQKLRFASAFKKYVKSAEPSPSPLPRPLPFPVLRNPVVNYALVAAVLVIACGIAWLSWKNLRNPAQRRPGPVFTVTLTSGLSREGGEIGKFAIPAGTDTVKFRLAVAADEYPFYRATLQNADDKVVATNDNLKAESANARNFVIVNVSSDLLPPGDYRFKLSGMTTAGVSEDISRYSFGVRSR